MRESLRPIFTTFQDATIVKVGILAVYLLLKKFIDSLSGGAASTVILLVVFDLITGVLAAIKNKKRIASRLWYRSPLKIANYCILISIGHLTADMLFLSWLDGVMVMLIVTTEVLSIIENISVIQPRLIPKGVSRMIGIFKTERWG